MPEDEEDCMLDEGTESDAQRLPWGVRKKLIEAAPSECIGRPRIGDEVSVNFVAKLQDGKEVGSCRDSAKPFRFVLGQQPRQVVEGFELGVQTMKRGEIAEFTIAPRFAYDDLGSPPLIPPDTTMVFEVELLGWEAKVDLFEDGRAVKTVLERGSGEAKPRLGQDVLMTLKVVAKSGKLIEEYDSVEHVVGCPDFGLSSKIVTQALLHMVEGERCSVFLRRFAGDTLVDRTLQGAKLELSLLRLFATSDVSPTQDGSLVKKTLSQGSGEACHEAGRARLLVTKATDGTKAISGFVGEQTLEFTVGDGNVCDALEFVAATMKPGEQAVLTCFQPSQCCEPQLGLRDLQQLQRVVLTVELCSLTGDVVSMASSLEQRLSFAGARKAVGASLFKQQRYRLALERYNRIAALIGPSDDESSVRELLSTCELNRAACLLKLDDNARAKAACDKVLSWEPNQVKALYRRGSALFALSDYPAAQKDLIKVLKLDPKNSEARALISRVKEAQKRYAETARSTAARMCGTTDAMASLPALAKNELPTPRMRVFTPLTAILACLPLPCHR
mmetsp:Transcript_63082/g.174846  ORF Transcript_63082/g.174846 Transcript_63082/m.174846 type:complete len:560 (+) Transcript_63082:58-1737(+)